MTETDGTREHAHRHPGGHPADPGFPAYRRVYLAPLDMNGLADMHEYSCRPEFYRFFEDPRPHESIDQTRAYLEGLMDRERNGYGGGDSKYWFIRRCVDDKVIGSIGLTAWNRRRRSAVFGFGIAPQEWGAGDIFEAIGCLMQHVFEQLGLERLEGITRCDNTPTLAVMCGTGFAQEGRLREFYASDDGRRYDGILFGLLKFEAQPQRCFGLARIAGTGAGDGSNPTNKGEPL